MKTPTETKDLLIEIGCEELPAKTLKKLQDAFVLEITTLLNQAQLSFEERKAFATPRRLAVLIKNLSLQQPIQSVVKRGPAKGAAFDAQNNPTKAALGFAESCGVPMEALTLQETDKGAWLIFKQDIPGNTAKALLPAMIQKALEALPAKKRMRWGTLSETFVRPVHWVVMLLGEEIISAELFGIKTNRFTFGHRFHHPGAILLPTPLEYENSLEKTGKVIPSYEKRKNSIRDEMHRLAEQKKCVPIVEEALLEEVTGLVEWPVVLLAQFKSVFLKIPREALISAMQVHQKCFPVHDQKGQLLPNFVLVSNIESKDPNAVIAGNESVMHARLSDAAFYYQIDKETALRDRQEGLKQVVFQAGLGTLWDKSHRLAHLAQHIARSIKADPIYTERAALLSKTDLLTQMVGEFPELQGIMGKYYALNDAEPEVVALAIEEHYHPRFAKDTLPVTLEGCAVAIADRIDSLVGIFGIRKRPTGEKDPFALRRQTLGILRIIIEKGLNLDLRELFHTAKIAYKDSLLEPEVVEQVLDFCFERLRAFYADQGIPARVFEAVLAKRPTKPFDFHKRIQAVFEFQSLKEAESLAAANKRVQNILSKSDITLPFDATPRDALLIENAEKLLFKLLLDKETEVAPLIKAGNYTEALKSLAQLREPIDTFFTEVMVMAEDPDLRNNRFRLLSKLRRIFLEIADISLL